MDRLALPRGNADTLRKLLKDINLTAIEFVTAYHRLGRKSRPWATFSPWRRPVASELFGAD